MLIETIIIIKILFNPAFFISHYSFILIQMMSSESCKEKKKDIN